MHQQQQPQQVIVSNGGSSQGAPMQQSPFGQPGIQGAPALPMIDFQDPAAFASLTPEQQHQLFIAFSQSLNSGHNMMFPANAGAGNQQGSNERGPVSSSMDFNGRSVAADHQKQHSESVPSSTFSHQQTSIPTSSSVTVFPTIPVHNNSNNNGLTENFFLQSSNPGVAMMNMDQNSYHHQQQQQQQQQQRLLNGHSMIVDTPVSLSNGIQNNDSQQQQRNYNNNYNNNQRPSFDNITTNGLRLGSPESVTSPGSMTEDAILQSWSISTFHDQIYLNPNLARDDPRNDLGTFVYLPSEFEYGDAQALSPSASSTGTGGPGSVTNSGAHGSGSEGGTSPRIHQ